MTQAAFDPSLRQFRERAQAGDASMLWLVAVIVRERRTVLSLTGVGLVIALAVALLRPPTYSTNFSFVPQGGQDAGRSGLASLAGQFGVSLGAMGGQGQSPQFYADLLETREILHPIAADSFAADGSRAPIPLVRLLGRGDAPTGDQVDEAVRVLREKVIKASVAPLATGVVDVTVRTESPQLSLAIADRLVGALNQFNLVTRQTQAAAERRFVEGRLLASRVALRRAEDALERFLQLNRIATSPDLVLEGGRLESEVGVQRQLVTGLVQQYEEARIREVRDTPILTIIERPALAARSDPQHRGITLVAGGFSALLLAVCITLIKDAIDRRRQTGSDPAVALLAAEWRRLRGGRA